MGFRLPSSNLELASTVSLEGIGSTLPVDTIRGKPRTWFSSIAVALLFGYTDVRYTSCTPTDMGHCETLSAHPTKELSDQIKCRDREEVLDRGSEHGMLLDQ